MIVASRNRNIAMYSLTRLSTRQLARMQSGKKKVVSMTNGSEMPSMPSL